MANTCISFLAWEGKVNLPLAHAQDFEEEETAEPVRVYHGPPMQSISSIQRHSALFAQAAFAACTDS